MIKISNLIIIIFLFFSCNKELKKMNSEKENASPANQIIGQIIRNSEDSTNLIFTITNLSNEDILVPRELGSRGNAITFSLPSGNPS